MKSDIQQRVIILLIFHLMGGMAWPNFMSSNSVSQNTSSPLYLSDRSVEEGRSLESVSRILGGCSSPCLKCHDNGSGKAKCTSCNTYGNTPYLDSYALTCRVSCISPLVGKSALLGLIKYCDLPCSTGNFLYPDSSCASSCPSPFTQSTDWIWN